MTLPIATIKAALISWLGATTTGFTLTYAHQNTPEPNGPYISINPGVSIGNIGMFDEAVFDTTTALYTVHAHRRLMVSIQALGAGALLALTSARDSLDRPTLYQSWFVDRGLSAIPSEIRNLTGLKGSRYEQRAQMDLTITYLAAASGGGAITDDPGYADTIEYDSPSLNIPTTTITGD